MEKNDKRSAMSLQPIGLHSKFAASQGYVVRVYLKQNKEQTNKKNLN